MHPSTSGKTRLRCFYLAAAAVSAFCTLASSLQPSQAFTLKPEREGLSEFTVSDAPIVSSETATVASEPGESVKTLRKNDYTRLTQTLDNLNFSSDGIASYIDGYIGWTGFALSDDNVSSSVVDSINSELGIKSNQASSSGFVSLKEGIGKTQAAANRANAANAAASEPSSSGKELAVGPSYAELKEMKNSDEPPPLLLVVGASFASVFLVSRVVR